MTDIYNIGSFVGRVWSKETEGPLLVKIKDGSLHDITSKQTPTMRDLLEMQNPAEYISGVEGIKIISLNKIEENVHNKVFDPDFKILAPCDLQVVKACGVTFAKSMVERVIEERAAGDPKKAELLRTNIGGLIGSSLKDIVPGSAKAMEVKDILIKEGLWSQYLEVGIGKDAEVFTKAQVLSSVGHGSEVGLHPISNWNNPEPEIVLAVNSKGKVVGTALGNDVNLRDFEGRSALLLGKAKDNNGSCAIGPFIRLFDDQFTLDDVRQANITLSVKGSDGFTLEGSSSMKHISRDPLKLVQQCFGSHHQYPDGLMLFLGTMFSPIQDRDVPGQGFTHKVGDIVHIQTPLLGSLINRVNTCDQIPPWTFGTMALMQNLSQRGLL